MFEVEIERMGGWWWYCSHDNYKQFEKHKCGKWMHFFDKDKQDFAQYICEKSIEEGVCYECKCTDIEAQQTPQGVICFYLNSDDIENHKRIIKFMMENNLIRKTKTGRYYNTPFKFDYQTRAGEYGSDFEAKITLSDFIDLNSGEWIQ